MKYLSKLIGIYLAFLIQSLFFENLKIVSCTPSVLITMVVIYSVSSDYIKAAVIGAFAGLLTDVMYGEVFGINILINMYLALLVSLATDVKNTNSPLIMSWICFISTAAMEIVITVVKSLLISRADIGLLCKSILIKGVFAALFALVYVLIIQSMVKRKKTTSGVITYSGEEAAE